MHCLVVVGNPPIGLPGKGLLNRIGLHAELHVLIPVQHDLKLLRIWLQASGNQAIGVAQLGDANLRDKINRRNHIEHRVCARSHREPASTTTYSNVAAGNLNQLFDSLAGHGWT